MVRLYQLLKEYPLLSNKQIAERLGVTIQAISSAKKRIKQMGEMAKLYCPSCMVLSLTPCEEGYACEQCGRVFEKENIKVNPFFRSPVNALHWGKSLGSDLDCGGLQKYKVIASKPSIIRSQIFESIDDKDVRDCLEELMRHIRTFNLDLATTDSLGQLMRAKIKEFKAKYPLIPIKGKIKQSIILEVLALASLDFPRLKVAYRSYLQKMVER